MHGHPDECGRARLAASLAVDGEIAELELASLRAHLPGCPACSAFARSTEQLAELLRAAPLVAPPASLTARPQPRRRLAVGRLQLAASAAAVLAALALGSLAGLLHGSGRGSGTPQPAAATHRLLIEQSLLALAAGSAGRSDRHGRVFPT